MVAQFPQGKVLGRTVGGVGMVFECGPVVFMSSEGVDGGGLFCPSESGRFGFDCSGSKYFQPQILFLCRNHVRGDLPTDCVSDAIHVRMLFLNKTPAASSRPPIGSVLDHLARHFEKGQICKTIFYK